jgi:hypothetical protein
LDVSPDDRRLASVGGGGVKVWDLATGQELLTLHGQTAVRFGDGGRVLAAYRQDGALVLWDSAPLP